MRPLFNSLATAVRRGLWPLAALAALAGTAPAETLRVAVLSDMNGNYGSTRYQSEVLGAVRRVVSLRPDLVVLNGDMVAGQHQPPLGEQQTRAMWSAFHRAVTTPLARAGLAVAPVPGNHDASARRGFQAERQIYGQEWADRKPDVVWVDDRQFPFNYAFALRGTLFVMLDTTRAGRLPPEQIAWLSRLLAQRRHATTVVFGHMPLWPITQGRETEIITDPQLASLLQTYGVALHVSGHHHAFHAGTSGGVVYVTNASLGGLRRQPVGQTTRAPHGFTLIEIADDGRITIAPLTAPGFSKHLDPTTLPKRISSGLGTLTRLDLAPAGAVSFR